MKMFLSLAIVTLMYVVSFADDPRVYVKSVEQSRNAQTLCPTATTYVLTVSSTTNSTIPARTCREYLRIINTSGTNVVKAKLYYSAGVIDQGFTIDAKSTSSYSVNVFETKVYTGAVYLRQATSLGVGTAATATVEVIEIYR